MIKQISVFMENKPGRLLEVTKLLASNKVNIRTLSLADTAEFGIARLIVDYPDAVVEILKNNRFTARITPVLAVEVSDESGGLARVLEVFLESGINVEYMYGFVEKRHPDKALLVFKVEDPARAKDQLVAKGLTVVSEKDILS
ncbi:MAG: ACT domain-containing protein [Candidatus Riflemargulisbacteria bacterium]